MKLIKIRDHQSSSRDRALDVLKVASARAQDSKNVDVAICIVIGREEDGDLLYPSVDFSPSIVETLGYLEIIKNLLQAKLEENL